MELLLMLMIVVAVSLIASAILSSRAKGKEKKDKGFSFGYHRLTHRRRLIRTLWLLPVTVVLLLWIRQSGVMAPLEFTAMAVLLAIVFIAQVSYEYVKWKKHQKAA
ncbi:hypothetical protein ACTL32_10020 [Planococcus sp. FY231025]|uniref:hypothetical protein n=1 Tax=Planococcus sp. FY231025 TaxID=3455699 RepID=UPI003F92BEAE